MLARIPIGRLLVVGALLVLFVFLTVAIGLQATRLTLVQWLVALGLLAPIGGAIVAILWYSRGLGRATLERTTAQEALARSEAKFRGLYESTADSIFFVDRRGMIVDVNPAAQRLLEAPDSDLVGTEIDRFLRSPSLRFGDPDMEAILSGSVRAEGHEGVLTTSNGRERVVQLAAVVLRPEGADAQIVVVARDVTDQTELQRQLLESERWASMGRLASFVAHEINTPLTNISLLRASIARRVSDPDVLARLEKIGVQGKIAANITAELLKFAKPGAINVVEADLRDVVRSAVEQAEVYRKRSVAVRVDGKEHPLSCHLDPVRMQEVFVNLLKNAYEATPSGTVSVRIEERPEFLVVSVADTGSGMPEDVLGRIFEPFFTTKKKGEGTGLGLALSKSFVVAHGGDISAASAVGKGSTFSVSIPRRLDSEPSSADARAGLSAVDLVKQN